MLGRVAEVEDIVQETWFAAAKPGATSKHVAIHTTSFFIFFSFGLDGFPRILLGACVCTRLRHVSDTAYFSPGELPAEEPSSPNSAA